MKYGAKESYTVETGFKILNVVDGDGIILENTHTKEIIEFRLYGIDAPEVKRCRKLFEDEKKTHLPGQLLIELGFKSMRYLKNIATVGMNCDVAFEEGSTTDFYNRRLAYIYIDNGISLNEIMIRDGYAKPMSEYYCSKLHHYQRLNFAAKRAKKGLYSLTDLF